MGCEPEPLTRRAKPARPRKLDLPPGVPPLTSLYMYIAGSCNLACRHCWINPTYEPNNSKGQFLKLEYVKKAVREAKPLGLQSVKLTGGEPTLHPLFKEIVELLDKSDLDISIETNGTLITDELSAFLKSKSHVHFIAVSLDGAHAFTHDALREIPGSFDKAVFGIKSLIRAGFHPQVICTLHQGNIHEIDELMVFSKELGCGSIKFNHIQSMGRGENCRSSSGLSIKKIIELYSQITNKCKNNFKIHFDIPIAFSPIKFLLNNSHGRCSVLNILGLLANGDLSLCGIGTSVSDLIFGNIAHDDLIKIWEYNQKLNRIRDSIPNKIEGICCICVHRDFCLGNCIASNYYVSKKINASYNFCANAEKLGIFPESRKIV